MSAGPITVRRQLGRKLRKARESAGMEPSDVSAWKVSKTTLWRLENGKGAVKPPVVSFLCDLYKVDALDRQLLMQMALSTANQGWWDEYGAGLPAWFSWYLELEYACDELLIYDPTIVHGLLQTPGYARALFEANGPDEDTESINRQVEIRQERQEAVARRESPLRITALFSSAILKQEVGGKSVLARQRAHLLELAKMDHIDILVTPPQAGAHALSGFGPFTILDFHDPEDPAVVYLESLMGARYSEKPEEVKLHKARFDLCRKVSVPIEECK